MATKTPLVRNGIANSQTTTGTAATAMGEESVVERGAGVVEPTWKERKEVGVPQRHHHCHR